MSWINVAPYADIEGEETLPIEVDGQKICLYNLDGKVFATDNQCTHGDAALSDGLIQEGGLIECPFTKALLIFVRERRRELPARRICVAMRSRWRAGSSICVPRPARKSK